MQNEVNDCAYLKSKDCGPWFLDEERYRLVVEIGRYESVYPEQYENSYHI